MIEFTKEDLNLIVIMCSEGIAQYIDLNEELFAYEIRGLEELREKAMKVGKYE